jgi:hypothetical protein
VKTNAINELMCPGLHETAAAYFEQELTAVITYDHRFMNGCRDIGIATASPGRT